MSGLAGILDACGLAFSVAGIPITIYTTIYHNETVVGFLLVCLIGLTAWGLPALLAGGSWGSRFPVRFLGMSGGLWAVPGTILWGAVLVMVCAVLAVAAARVTDPWFFLCGATALLTAARAAFAYGEKGMPTMLSRGKPVGSA